jgi:hypothetical protein
MIIDVIYSALLLLAGCIMAVIIPFFGIKFCKNSGKLEVDATWKEFLWQLVKEYPVGIWILSFLAFQPAIVHIVNTWIPSLWTSINCEWIPQISDFIAIVTVTIFVVLLKITDDNGKLKFKKSE